MFAVSYYALPHEFTGIFGNDPERVVKNWHLFIAVAAGLWGGLLIGISTEYYTSNRYQPVKVRSVKLLDACRRGQVVWRPYASARTDENCMPHAACTASSIFC